MKALEEQKKIATADPEGFARTVSSRGIKTVGSGGLVVGPNPNIPKGESNDDDHDNVMDSDGGDRHEHMQEPSKFDDIPGPQNVVRCPPINWSKYHIVGEPLDKLHEEQRRKPTPGEAHGNEDSIGAADHFVAAQYNPWLISCRKRLCVLGA